MARSGSPADALRDRLSETEPRRPLLLDGATGTELERRGVVLNLPLWSTHALIRRPEVIREVHRDYAEAGAEILTAATFRTQATSLAKVGLAEQAQSLTRVAVELARQGADAAARPVFVAGSTPPLEDCYRPDLVPDDATLASAHAAHAENLARAHVDLVLIETINSAREAVAALEATRSVGLPAIVSFVCDHEARLLSGEPLATAIAAIAPFEVLAVGVNCLPTAALSANLRVLAGSARATACWPNLGTPEPGGWRHAQLDAGEFATLMLAESRACAAQALVLGGCCGTTPDHIRALAERLASQAPHPELPGAQRARIAPEAEAKR